MPPVRPRAEVALDVKRGGAAGACRRDRLTVDVVNQVARGEDAFDIGPGARMRNLDIPLVITDHLVTHQFGARLVPDGDEDAGDIERPVLVGDRNSRPLTSSPPTMSSTSVFQTNSTLGLSKARSCIAFDARSSSLRWMMYTRSANRVRKVASSIAESPPPTTATRWSP